MVIRIILADNDVVNFSGNMNPAGCHTSKIEEMMYKLVTENQHKSWMQEGQECEVLFGDGSNGWARGRIKVVCEFIPDEELIKNQTP